MASNKTVVKGIRASQEFFDKCDLVAKAEGVDRNKLIVRVMSEYIEKTNNDKISIVEKLLEEYSFLTQNQIKDFIEQSENIYYDISKKYKVNSCAINEKFKKTWLYEATKEIIKADLVEKVENEKD